MKGIRVILCLVSFLLLALPLTACGEKEKAPPALPDGFEGAQVPNTYLDGYLYLNQGTPFYLGQNLLSSPERITRAAFLLTPFESTEALWCNVDNDNWQNAQTTAAVANSVSLKTEYSEVWNLFQRMPSNPPDRIIGAGFLKSNSNVQKWLSEITQDPETIEQINEWLERAKITQVAIGLYSQNEIETVNLNEMDGAGISILVIGKSSYSGILLSPLLSLFGPQEDKIGQTTVYTATLGDLNLIIKNVGSYVYVSVSSDASTAKALLASVLNPETITEYQKRQLAEKYAPILYMHPDEEYEPKDVQIMIENAELKIKPWMTLIPLNQPLTSLDLYNVSQHEKSENLYLDIKGINLVEFEENKLQGAWAYLQKYREIENNYPTTVYAHVLTYRGKTVIQYWMFYFFNDGPDNNHEGDWEYVQVNIDGDNLQEVLNSGSPEITIYSQHWIQGSKKWTETTVVANHPIVYVAKGSHANYYSAGEWTFTKGISADSTVIGGKIIFQPMRSEREGRANYKLTLLPNLKEVERIEKEQPWLAFKGYWGQWLPEPLEWIVGGPVSIVTRNEWTKPILK